MTKALRPLIPASSAALALVFLTGGCHPVYYPQQQQIQDAEALIVLYVDGADCKAELRPKLIFAETDHKVEWYVRNTCPGDPRTVRLENFNITRKDGSKDKKHPFKEPEDKLKVTVGFGQKDKITAHIKSSSDFAGHYTYDAYNGNDPNPIDPDLEIWH